MSNFYDSGVLPRIELKFKAKELLRGNWSALIGVTLLFLLLTGVRVSFNYTENSTGTGTSGTGEMVSSYFSFSPFTSLGNAVAGLGVSTIALVAIVAIISAILIDGVLNYCYNAFFVTLTEIEHSRQLRFADFAAAFKDGLTAALAYIWQQLWLSIWGLVGLPGFLLLYYASEQGTVSLGGGLSIALGAVFFVIGLIISIIIMVRYSYIYQLIADSRGKIGARKALRYSCAITKGHIKELVLLELSFIPWYFLGLVTLGLGFLYVYPYIYATRALAYRWLRDQAFKSGQLDPAALGYKKSAAQEPGTATTIDI